MNNSTFLTNEQIYGNNRLDIISKYGTKCAASDYAILLGCWVTPDNYYTSEGTSFKDRAAWWWTKTSDGANQVYIASIKGDNGFFDKVRERIIGARPALPYSSIQSISSNLGISSNGILRVKCGECPQTIVNKIDSRELEDAFMRASTSLRATGELYTTDSVRLDAYNTPFKARSHIEYEYNGSKYIRFIGQDKNMK